MADVGATVKSLYSKPMKSLDNLGAELAFYVRALAWTPRTLRRYKKEIFRLLAEGVERLRGARIDRAEAGHVNSPSPGRAGSRPHS